MHKTICRNSFLFAGLCRFVICWLSFRLFYLRKFIYPIQLFTVAGVTVPLSSFPYFDRFSWDSTRAQTVFNCSYSFWLFLFIRFNLLIWLRYVKEPLCMLFSFGNLLFFLYPYESAADADTLSHIRLWFAYENLHIYNRSPFFWIVSV